MMKPPVFFVSRLSLFAGLFIFLWTCSAGSCLAATTPAAGESPASSLPLIVIDPGHPSEVSSGDELQNGVREVDTNWLVALLLKNFLEISGRCRVAMTLEEKGHLVTNRARAEFANHLGAACMLRLHCDTGSGHGFAFYYPDHSGTNAGKTGPSPAVIAESAIAARAIHDGTAKSLSASLRDNGIKTDRQTAVGGKYGALIGSIWSEVPVVTIEMVFLSNASDARFVSLPEGRKAIAAALAKGIEQYLDTRQKGVSPTCSTTIRLPVDTGNGTR
ncbi:MAG: N-acetylmuramoyl-L-alanine amidase [Candidatus Ozemobacteraceae bacterium]